MKLRVKTESAANDDRTSTIGARKSLEISQTGVNEKVTEKPQGVETTIGAGQAD